MLSLNRLMKPAIKAVLEETQLLNFQFLYTTKERRTVHTALVHGPCYGSRQAGREIPFEVYHLQLQKDDARTCKCKHRHLVRLKKKCEGCDIRARTCGARTVVHLGSTMGSHLQSMPQVGKKRTYGGTVYYFIVAVDRTLDWTLCSTSTLATTKTWNAKRPASFALGSATGCL